MSFELGDWLKIDGYDGVAPIYAKITTIKPRRRPSWLRVLWWKFLYVWRSE